jgi:cytochrome c553
VTGSVRRSWTRSTAKCLAVALVASVASLWLGLPSASAFDLQTELTRCEGCHGPKGRAEVMPLSGRIAGQNETYLFYILRQYRDGRLSGVNAAIMTYAMKQLSDAQIRSLAHYYAQLQ